MHIIRDLPDITTDRQDSLRVLPAYIRYILDHRLEDFISLQWRLSREAGAPVMRHFDGMPDEQLLSVALEPTRDFWRCLIDEGIDIQIPRWLAMWQANQMPLIGTDQVLADDITIGHYVKRLALMHYLSDYTEDFGLYTEISHEIDYYLQVVTAESFKIYIGLQGTREQESSRFAEAVLDSSHDVIVVFDQALRVAAINKRAHTHFSTTPDTSLGRHVSDIFPYMRPAFTTALEAALMGQDAFFERSPSHIGEGHFDIRLIPLTNEANGVYGVLCVAHDVTVATAGDTRMSDMSFSLRQKDEQLRRSQEEHLRMIAEVQDYAIILLGLDGTIRNWNMGAERIKGYTAREIIGHNFRLFYSEEDRRAQLPEQLIGLATTQSRATHEGWRIRKDGTRFWGSIVITALHNDAGDVIGFSKVTRDLSERKRAEEELKEKNAQLEERNEALNRRNKELNAFNHVASHDLQEPLRKIRLFANMILEPRHEADRQKATEYLRRIIGAADNMQRFMEDLLIYSKTHDLDTQYEPVDLQQVLDSVREELALPETMAADIVIDSDPLPAVTGVGFQLRQLLQNLIGNAIKYRKADTPLHIGISYAHLSGSALAHPDADPSRTYHLLTVSDNGIGFEQEYAAKIFEPFQRLHGKREYSGSGVGLAICREIALNHHALLYAEGARNKGATFYFALPVDL